MSSRTKIHGWRALASLAGALVLTLAVLPLAGPAFAAPAAPSQSSSCPDVYGCGTTSTPPAIQPQCSLSTTSAAPGTKVTATITNIPVGTEVTLYLDGNQVAKEKATADGQGEAALALPVLAGHVGATLVAAVQQDTSGGAVMTFTVPNDPGKGHTVVFSGAGFSCDATGGAGFEILGESTSKGNGGGSLSKTGFELGVYLAAALLLIVVGLQLVHVARNRRRAVRRRQHHGRHRSGSRSRETISR